MQFVVPLKVQKSTHSVRLFPILLHLPLEQRHTDESLCAVCSFSYMRQDDPRGAILVVSMFGHSDVLPLSRSQGFSLSFLLPHFFTRSILVNLHLSLSLLSHPLYPPSPLIFLPHFTHTHTHTLPPSLSNPGFKGYLQWISMLQLVEKSPASLHTTSSEAISHSVQQAELVSLDRK